DGLPARRPAPGRPGGRRQWPLGQAQPRSAFRTGAREPRRIGAGRAALALAGRTGTSADVEPGTRVAHGPAPLTHTARRRHGNVRTDDRSLLPPERSAPPAVRPLVLLPAANRVDDPGAHGPGLRAVVGAPGRGPRHGRGRANAAGRRGRRGQAPTRAL